MDILENDYVSLEYNYVDYRRNFSYRVLSINNTPYLIIANSDFKRNQIFFGERKYGKIIKDMHDAASCIALIKIENLFEVEIPEELKLILLYNLNQVV